MMVLKKPKARKIWIKMIQPRETKMIQNSKTKFKTLINHQVLGNHANLEVHVNRAVLVNHANLGVHANPVSPAVLESPEAPVSPENLEVHVSLENLEVHVSLENLLKLINQKTPANPHSLIILESLLSPKNVMKLTNLVEKKIFKDLKVLITLTLLAVSLIP